MREFHELTSDLRARLRVLQIIIGALCLGLVLFGVIVLVMILQPAGGTATPASGNSTAPALRMVWAMLVVMEAPFYLVFRAMSNRSMVAESEVRDESILAKYFVTTLIGAALAEGVSLFGIVIMLLSYNPMDAVLAAPGLLAMLVFFPTSAKFNSFRRSIHEARTLRGASM